MSENTQRELAAILFADIVGFSSIMANDESNALELIKKLDDLINPIINEANGKLIKKLGDGYLIKFNSSVDAVKSSIKIQESIEQKSDQINNVKLRIGIHLGDIVIDGEDVMGDGVNIASRVEAFAEPGGVCMTQAVYQSVKSNVKIEVKDKGEVELKNIIDKYYLYKYPKIDLENNDKEDQLDEQNSINISSIKKVPPITRGFVNSFWIALFITFTLFAGMWIFGNIIDLASSIFYPEGGSYAFSPPEIPNNKQWLIVTIYFIIIWVFSIWHSYRVSCKDIKSINSLIDYCVSEMGYIKKRQSGGNITYVCGICGKYKGIIGKYSEFMGRISIRIDGNVLVVSGPWNYVNKLIKNLKSLV